MIHIKKILKPIIRGLVKNKISWYVISFFIKISYRFKFEKDLIAIEKKQEVFEKKQQRLKDLFKDLTVKHGPFKDMKYPDFQAHGSSIYPKLLGSYESELFDIINHILEQPYENIVDVGCAEGYYAVGLARSMPNVRVYAYDISDDALKICKRMAELNNVSEQIVLRNECTPQELATFNFGKKSLIVCDCEGYEIELFTKENISNLINTDVLIELHDGKNEFISPYISELFASTHDTNIIRSVNCFSKAKDYAETKDLNDFELKTCLEERGGIMEWFFLTPKKKTKN